MNDIAHLAHVEVYTDRYDAAWGLKTIASFHTHGTPPVPSGAH